MTLQSNAEELALIAQEIGAELALEALLGEPDAAQAVWYILLLNGGASFTSGEPWQEQKRAIPQRDSPFVATLYEAYSLVLQRRVA